MRIRLQEMLIVLTPFFALIRFGHFSSETVFVEEVLFKISFKYETSHLHVMVFKSCHQRILAVGESSVNFCSFLKGERERLSEENNERNVCRLTFRYVQDLSDPFFRLKNFHICVVFGVSHQNTTKQRI